jgi:hypothetical protein
MPSTRRIADRAALDRERDALGWRATMVDGHGDARFCPGKLYEALVEVAPSQDLEGTAHCIFSYDRLS